MLHWVERDESGKTMITRAELDENGAYGKWPVDFDDVERDAMRSYLDAVEFKVFHK